tara:strand:- start:217 stop:1116 length:900 start_codon:yes stop_codon:yes gene_type:complete
MRTEYAWYVALDSTHHHISQLPTLPEKKYDLGIVIIPKTNIEELMMFPMIEQMKRVCKKIGFMQEGPHWYFQDYPMEHQIWFYNTLMEMDVLFCHNEVDIDYFKGITGKKQVYKMPSLMITDHIKTSEEKELSVVIGGNMVRWYGGFDSYIVAQEFSCIEDINVPIYAPSMGRKIEREDELEINHLPYMTWLEWQTELSKHKFAVHLMTTHAAGTFALNCAYLGIPCIGYRGLDTQEQLHPLLSVDYGNIEHAKAKARRLIRDSQLYERCSKQAKENYEKYYSENTYNKYIKRVLDEIN